jgi:DNA ligase (NAD+)
MAKKSAENILASIESSKKTTFAKFVYALGIRNVGAHLSKVLESKYSSNLRRFQQATFEELELINEVGPIVAEGIVQFWSDESNLAIIDSCINYGIKFEEASGPISQKFENLSFVFTGTLTSLTRSEAKRIVESNGGRVNSAVSNNTNFVVAGKSAGSKLEKAGLLGVKIITENEFLEMK